MRKFFFFLLFVTAISVQSCRETEMNTDGDMEQNDSEVTPNT